MITFAYILIGLVLTIMGVWSSCLFIPFCLGRECWNGTRGFLEFSMTLGASIAVTGFCFFLAYLGIMTLLVGGFGLEF